ncbi:Lhr family ATP-dependent helicase [Arthrobacter castelli]|uniref:Lhr family ATP-dependent helicase n=1 Tax=Arthrobacter castelli TaxID=271431 RepID=UPI000414FF7F|nr:DEAD/DEAH box helicase [Arthrobacter castelli]
MDAPLEQFTAATRQWFEGAFAAPTDSQVGAWNAITADANTLVVAPTGSGKTLAAFLSALDRLIAHPNEGKRGTRVLYVSPLKALGVDVERNLRSPLIGIAQTAKKLSVEPPHVSVGVRSGDTSQSERRAMLARPPDILITTPESLFLMLTSRARSTLADVDTVIVDEVHAVAGTKRGAHLALTLERLDAMLSRPAQRIGLSATVEPHDTVARFLGGNSPVTIVAPEAQKNWDVTVSVPVPDMTELPAAAADDDDGTAPQASIWPHVEERIADLVAARQSSIVFANSRRLAERLTSRLNEIHANRLAWADTSVRDVPDGPRPASGNGSKPPAEIMAQAGSTSGAGQGDGSGGLRRSGEGPAPSVRGEGAAEDAVLARAHHGSVSKEARALIEDDLKSGRLRCVVATSSLELGIDMGAVDLVVQVESPPSVASGLQRVGRAGHQVGEISEGVFFPKHRGDLVHSAITVERMLAGRIEPLSIPSNPLDVLAQQTVAACALDSIDVEEWFDVVRRSAPFASLPRSAFEATLDLMAGRYPSDEFAGLRPRIVWDRVAETITGRPGAQRLAVTSGGTIPDRGLFGVYLVSGQDTDTSKAPGGRRVGELDEEMVYESRVGDVFALGATSWRIEDITHDRVLVTPAYGQPGKLPFWKGDSPGRPVELGRALGTFIRELSNTDADTARKRCLDCGLDDWAVDNLLAYLTEQATATGQVPDDRALVVERFQDELGDWRVVLHSPFGMPVHAPWALAVGARLEQRYGMDGSAMASDDGIVLRVPMMDDEPPGADLFLFDPAELETIVTAEVGGSALFASRFRECAARALLLPRQNPGKRSPLWQQRQRSAQLLDVARKYPTFPIVLETVRECLQDVYDVPALQDIAGQIERRELRVLETTTGQPSPFARSLLFGYVASFLYEGDSPLAERRAAALSLDPSMLAELLGRAELRELLDAEVIARTEAELQRLAPDRRVHGIEGVADLLRLLGPLTTSEVAARLDSGERNGPNGAVPAGSASGTGSAGSAGSAGGTGSAGSAGGTGSAGSAGGTGSASGTGSAGSAGGAAARTSAEVATSPSGSPLQGATSRVRDYLSGDDGGYPLRDSNWHQGGDYPEGNQGGDYPGGNQGEDPGGSPGGHEAALLHLENLVKTNRALRVNIAGIEQWAPIEDAARLRDALGTPLPMGVPLAFVEPVADPLGDLIGRYARTHGPFTSAETAGRLGLGTAVVESTLRRLADESRVVEGEFRPAESGPAADDAALAGLTVDHAPAGSEWCDTDVLRKLRRRSLAALRHDVEPVDPATYGRFLPSWQNVIGSPGSTSLRGLEGVASVIDQLAGVPIPASAWEPLVLSARVSDYSPSMLDELMASGEVLWAGAGSVAGNDGWISLHLADSAPLTLNPSDSFEPSRMQQRIMDYLENGGAYFFRQLADVALAGTEADAAPATPAAEGTGDEAVIDALWDLAWEGRISNDTFTPVRSLLAGGRTAHKQRATTPRVRSMRHSRRGSLPGRGLGARGMAGSAAGGSSGGPRSSPPIVAGRWSLLPATERDTTVYAHATAELLLDRYGILTRGAVSAEGIPGGFALQYKVLTGLEDMGRCRRGYFIESLGAAQFALPSTVDRVRSFNDDAQLQKRDPNAVALAATDPANPYGAALPWPGSETGHRPGRKAGAMVILVDGELSLYVERGGKTLLAFTDDDGILAPAARALAGTVRRGAVDKLAVEKVNGTEILGSPMGQALEEAGFYTTPRGLRIRK